ncbi:MAG: CotH kinase family protein, partial [Candidatus Krumholzibacteria bacterium]|nr:CotH kinase family protein [Candidatus Krumholzibacteria bacterium]
MKKPARFAFSAVALVVVALLAAAPTHKDMISQLWGLNQLYFFEFKQKLRTRLLPRIDKRFTFTVSDSLAPAPVPSLVGGFYADPVTIDLSVSTRAGATIRYTLDGSTPTQQSRRYQKPITLHRTRVLRFRSFRSGYLPSETMTHTYFVSTDFRLPVVSLVTDPVVLWNRYSGIYANSLRRGRKWERGAHVEYFARGNSQPLRLPVQLRMHGGGWARKQTKKPFRLRYATAGLQPATADDLLTQKSTESEREVMLRPTMINHTARLGDELFTQLYSQIGGSVSASIEVLLFLNGEAWGLYRLHERINEEYLRRRFGAAQYDLIRDQRADSPALAGNTVHWKKTLDFFRSHDMTDDDQFARASELIDIDNTIDYWLFNIYAGNYDWPHNNTYLYRRRAGPDTRWRWISWDTDFAFRPGVVGKNTLAWATRNEPRTDLVVNPGQWKDKESNFFETLIVRRLLENESFRHRFVTRFCDLTHSVLEAKHIEAELDRIMEAKSHDIGTELIRWPDSRERYLRGSRDIRTFAHQRPEIILGYFQKTFGLGELLTVTFA